MALKKEYATIDGKCYERVMVIPPGENDWIAHPTRGAFKLCGSYPPVKNDITEPKVFAARNDDRNIIPSPVYLVSQNENRGIETPVVIGNDRVFDAVEDRDASTITGRTSLLDEDGNELPDDSGGFGGNSETKSKTLYWVAAIIILLVVFRKRLGFG